MKTSPDALWAQIEQIINALASPAASNAHIALRIEVEFSVGKARLPASLHGVPEARREIAARVLRALEDNDHAHLREWRRRQRRGDPSSWAGFLRVLITQQALLYEQERRLKLGPLRRRAGDRDPQ